MTRCVVCRGAQDRIEPPHLCKACLSRAGHGIGVGRWVACTEAEYTGLVVRMDGESIAVIEMSDGDTVHLPVAELVAEIRNR